MRHLGSYQIPIYEQQNFMTSLSTTAPPVGAKQTHTHTHTNNRQTKCGGCGESRGGGATLPRVVLLKPTKKNVQNQ